MLKQRTVLFGLAMLMGATLTSPAQVINNPLTPVGPETGKQQRPTAPAAPTAQVTPDNPFPPVNPRMFTAAQPTKEQVNQYLQALWGYDPSRIWSVAGIETTPAPGVSRVTVLMANRNGSSLQRAVFFVLPDQKHVISENVLPFGPQPFAELRSTLQSRANGPAHGAAGKDLLIVEFADLQCPRCAEVQGMMTQLAQDFPQARFVFEDSPVDGHPASYLAALYGECVAQQGSDAFFKYQQAIYDNQDALAANGAEQAIKDAVVKAGQDANAIAACSQTQPPKDTVAETVKLARDAGVDQTPVVFINGRMVGLSAINYETLKAIVLHQAQMDGIQLPMPAPRLQTLQ